LEGRIGRDSISVERRYDDYLLIKGQEERGLLQKRKEELLIKSKTQGKGLVGGVGGCGGFHFGESFFFFRGGKRLCYTKTHTNCWGRWPENRYDYLKKKKGASQKGPRRSTHQWMQERHLQR